MKVFVIGRNPVVNSGETAIVVEDSSNSISRTHCRITQIDEKTFFIEDAGSKNGTYIGNAKVGEAVSVKPDDMIRLADHINFTANDVVKGVKLKVKKTDQSQAGQKPNVEPQKQVPEKEIQIPDQQPQAEDKSPVIKQNQPAFIVNKPGKTPQIEQIIPVLKGTAAGSVSSGYLLVALAIALVASFTAYFHNNSNKSSVGGSFVKDFISAITTEKWITYSNSYLTFDYPAHWTPTTLGGEIGVARFSDDTLMLTVSIYECENIFDKDDAYSLFRSGIDCSMVSSFRDNPENILLIGMQEEMVIRHTLQTLKGHYNWQYLSFSGPALTGKQFLEQMDDNIQRSAKELNGAPQGNRKNFIKRNHYVCNAAALNDNHTVVIASAFATGSDSEIISDYFIRIIKSLQLKN